MLREDGRSERAIFVIDKQGIVRYVDVHDIDDQPDNDVLFGVLAELEPEAAAALEAEQDESQPVPSADVVIYCTPWCYDCRKARDYLEERGIEYVEIDVSRDREADQRIREWAGGYRITPTFNIKGTVVLDFDQDKLAEVLGTG